MYCSESETRITTDLPAVFDELLQSAHGDFSYIKKTLINLVVLTYRFAEVILTVLKMNMMLSNIYSAVKVWKHCPKNLFPC